MTTSTLAILTIAFPWVGAMLIWLVGDKYNKVITTLAVAFAALAGVSALALIPTAGDQAVFSYSFGAPYGIFTFVPDGLGVMLASIATVIGCLAVIFSIEYMKGEDQLARYYAFILFFIGGMVGLVLTGNMFCMFLFWEITALCSYALISFNNDDPKAVAGGIKALIITQVGGVGLLIGALIIYTYTGSFEINAFLKNPSLVPAGMLSLTAFGFLAAAAAKSAQFPFQTWLPDAMEAPTPISALIHAATMVNAGVYLLARFYPAFESVPGWRTSVLAVGVITALITSVMGLVANDLKRVLAYSTVSQLGYMVFAIGAGSVFASQFHLFSHAIFKALLFLAAGAVIHSVGTRDMRKMGGLGKQMPLVRSVFIIGSLALAGIPILNGFWSKELILEAGIAHAPVWTAFMFIGAGLTALYTLRMVWLVFYGEPREHLHGHDAGPAMKVALIPLAIGAIISWLAAGWMGELFHATLPYHEIHTAGLGEILLEVVSAPATYAALAVIALGGIAWWQRQKLSGIQKAFGFLSSAAENSFGFEAINRAIVNTVEKLAEGIRPLQTGILSWNIAGILGAIILILIAVVWGA